jgi:hypothetical protein
MTKLLVLFLQKKFGIRVIGDEARRRGGDEVMRL